MNTRIRTTMFAMLCLLVAGFTSDTFAQELIPFGPRTTIENLRGNLTITANDIVGIVHKDGTDLDPNAAYNAPFEANGNYITAYIDVDGDPSTFSSSDANLTVPNETCSRIVSAGLYWSANYYMARSRNLDNFTDQFVTPEARRSGNNESTRGIATNTDVILTVNNGPFAQQYTARYAQFDNDNSDIKLSPVSSYLVVAQPENGCNITNGAEISGNIAVIRAGGGCSFREKVLQAQQQGAVGVVIVDNTSNDLPRMDGGGAAINIPSVSVGNSIRDAENDFNGNLITLLNNFNGVVLGTLSTAGGAQLTDLSDTDPRKFGPADFRNIKFKNASRGAYVDVTADNVVWDGYKNTVTNTQRDVFDRDGDGDRNEFIANDEVQYVCYADVTNLIDPANPFGTYTVANMNATQGYTPGFDGSCGGWVMVVIYENLLESSKFISVQDGYVQIFPPADGQPNPIVDFDFNGFRTLQGSQPVDVTFGVATLEGDKRWIGDQLLIERTPQGSGNYTQLGSGFNNVTDINPVTNFFNSSITIDNNYITPRNPQSINTMGFDADLFELPNAGNQLIGNNQTNANFRLETDEDRYSVFLGTFSVTVIEPELRIIKRVFALDGTTEITNGNVRLGDEIFYDLEIENVGNEEFVDGTVTITDILPANTDLLNVESVPTGVTFTETTPGTIVFNIPADLVETDKDGNGSKDNPITIRFRAQLVSSCEELRDACSDVIQNSATATYTGAVSGLPGDTTSSSEIDPTCQTTGGEASNILVEVPPCSQDVTFCNDDLTLVAGTGYDQYTWTGPGLATPVVQLTSNNPNANVFVVPNPQTGVYQVVKEDTDPADGTCMTLTELFDVEDFRDIENPILNFVNGDDVVTENCTGLEVPQILLCGDRTFDLSTSFSSTNLISISWQGLTASGSCVSDPNDPCSLLSVDCTDSNWTELPNGDTANFTVEDAGDYRILAEFDGGCVLPFYFSVFKNNYQPALSANPIECGNDGSVAITNVPNNFGFSLNPTGPFTNTSGIFAVSTPGDVIVYAKDLSFASGCTYQASINVPSFDPTFLATPINPSCINDDSGTGTGSIQINVTGGSPEYQYTISGGGLTNPIVIPNSNANNGSFRQDNLLPGTYDVEMISNRPAPECIDSQQVTITAATDIRGTAVLVAPPTCDNTALIQINVTPPGNYTYSNGNGNFQTSNRFQIDSTLPGPPYTFFINDEDVPAGTPDCIIEVPFNDPIPDYEPIVIDNVNPIDPPCPGDEARVQVQVSPSVSGREYTYELLSSTSATDTVLVNQQTIVSPLQDITFTGVPDNDFYTVRVSHNNTTPPGTTPPTICPVEFGKFAVNTPDGIDFDLVLQRPLSCIAGSEDAIIRVENLSGGNGTYEWSLDNVNFTAITLPNEDITVSAPADPYIIYVRDAGVGDCAVSRNITVPDLLEIDDIIFTAGNDDCPAQTSEVTFEAQPALTATEIAAGVTITYNVTPDPASGTAATGSTGFVATNTYSITQNVTYTVVARRSDSQCELSRDYRVDLQPQVDITSAVQVSPVSCNGGNDGSLSFTVDLSELTAYDYTIEDASATSIATGTGITTATTTISSPGTALVAGTYTITVTGTGSSGANCTDTATVTITEPTVITFTPEILDQDCITSENTVGVSGVTGGNGPVYTFEILDGTGGTTLFGPTRTDQTITNVPNGTGYVIRVTDTDGCSNESAPFDINALPGITLAIPSSDLCLDDGIATIDVDITDGTADFSYRIERDGTQIIGLTALPTGATSFTTPDLTQAGSYEIFVTDSNGCVESITQVIAPQLTINTSLIKDLTCEPGNEDAQIGITTTGGNGATSLEININGTGFNPYTGPIPFTTTTAGTYQFRVVDSANPVCNADSTIITITPAPNPVVNSPTITNPTCNGDINGVVVVNIDTTVGTGPYQINFNGLGFSNQTTYGGLAEGIYNYTVRDAKQCEETFSITLSAPAVVIGNTIVTNITCGAGGNVPGALELQNINGGVPPYTVELLNTADLTSVTTTTTNPFTAITSGSNVTFDNLEFGDYIIRVIDDNGCVFDFAENIATQAIFDITESTTADCADGVTANINVSGGVGPFEIREFPSGTFVPLNGLPVSSGGAVERNHQFTNLPFGTPFQFEVIDTNTNCTDIRTLDPQPNPSGLEIIPTAIPVRCVGANDGEVTFVVNEYEGTQLNYEIFRTDDLTTPITGTYTFPLGNPQTVAIGGAGSSANGSATGFGPGTYLIRVTEDAGLPDTCNAAAEFTITESATPFAYDSTMIIDGNCNASSQGIVSVSGGTSPYGYFVTPDGVAPPLPIVYDPSNVVTLDQNISLDWDLYLIDANGCELGPIDISASVIEDPQFTVVPTFVDDACTYDNNYTLTVQATGIGQLQFGIDDGDTSTGDTPNFVNGTLVTAGPPDTYEFQYTMTSSSVDSYTLTVRDANGCAATSSIIVYDPLDISAEFTSPPTCNDPDGVITATITGTIAGNETFVLQDATGTATGNTTGATTGVFTGVAPGNYIVEVTDDGRGPAPGCSFTAPVGIIAPIEPLLVTAPNTSITCNGDTDGTIQAVLDPATEDPNAVYTYEIIAPAGAVTPAQTSPIFANLGPGIYTVQVTATLSNGTLDVVCIDDQAYTIDDVTVPTATVAQGSQFDCDVTTDGTENATILISAVTGGNGADYTANVLETGGAFTQNDIALVVTPPGITTVEVPVSGTYEVRIFDSNNCESIVYTVVIDPYVTLNNPVVSIDQDITCTTDEDITITVQDGSGNFLFELIDNNGTQITPPAPITTVANQSATFTLPRDLGVYTFRITDQGDGSGLGAGCFVTVSHEIDEFDFIEIAAAEETPVSCFGDADGTANLTITGYTGTFSYEILDQNGNSLTPPETGTGNATTDPFTVVLTNPLAQGAYTINVVETATPNCEEDSNAFTISGPDREVLLDIIAINDQEFCDPMDNGAFQATATGIRGTVSYRAEGTATGFDQTNTTGLFDGLSADTYTITVSDVVSATVTCTATGTFVVNPPADDVAITATATQISCFGEQDGTITAMATATNITVDTPIQYTITPVGGTESARINPGNFGNLAASDYIITAYDNFNCTAATMPINIQEPAEPTVAIDAISLLDCGDTQATITISGTADTALGRTVATFFAVDADDNPIADNTTGTFTLGVGEYRFYVEDNEGCRSPFSNPVPVILLEDIVFELDLAQAVVNCRDEATGSVDLLRVNGQTRLTGGFGTYNFRLENTTTGQFWPGPTATDTRDAPYLVDGVQVPPSFFRELPPGDYIYYVNTERNCVTQNTFSIANPPVFERIEPEVTNVSCFGEGDGQVRVFAQGGTPPFSFAISSRPNVNFNDSSDNINGEHVFTELAPNDPATPYEIQVQDANGCSQIYEVTITEPTQIMAGIIGDVMPETCAGDMDGSVTIEIFGGTPPYEFNIVDDQDANFQPVPDPTNLFIGDLPAGQTIINVRDSLQCPISLPIEILPGVDINGALQPDRDCPVFDPITGVETSPLTYYVDFDAFGEDVLDDNLDIMYILEPVDPANPAPIQSPDDPRRYVVQPNIAYQGSMLHSRGCERILGEITVDEYIPLANLRAQMTGNPADPNEYELSIDGGADGNSEEYTYIVIRLDNVGLNDSDDVVQDAINNITNEDIEDGLLEENIFFIRRTGQYLVRVVDNVGCEFTAVLPLTYINLRVPNYFTPGRDDPNTPDFEDFWYPRQITPDQDPNTPDEFFFENMEVRVFDRYGRLLAEFKGFQRGWDGIYKGQELPSGDYWYTVILNDAENKEFTGHFTLYR